MFWRSALIVLFNILTGNQNMFVLHELLLTPFWLIPSGNSKKYLKSKVIQKISFNKPGEILNSSCWDQRNFSLPILALQHLHCACRPHIVKNTFLDCFYCSQYLNQPNPTPSFANPFLWLELWFRRSQAYTMVSNFSPAPCITSSSRSFVVLFKIDLQYILQQHSRYLHAESTVKIIEEICHFLSWFCSDLLWFKVYNMGSTVMGSTSLNKALIQFLFHNTHLTAQILL